MISVAKMAKMAAMTTIALAVLIAFGLRADAQSVPLSGKIVSASSRASVTGNNVFTTPQSGTKFVLTQWCVELNQAAQAGNAILTGSTFGFIAEIQGAYIISAENPGKAACVSFSPGYVMPFRETISCAEQSLEYSGGVTCSISGVLSATLP